MIENPLFQKFGEWWIFIFVQTWALMLKNSASTLQRPFFRLPTSSKS